MPNFKSIKNQPILAVELIKKINTKDINQLKINPFVVNLIKMKLGYAREMYKFDLWIGR